MLETVASGGTVVAFDRSGTPAVKEEYTAAIRMWCVDRSLSDALTREEIGAMSMKDRLDAQRKAIIIHLAQYYRDHKYVDVAPGVLVVTTFLSDNENGAATISQPTLAKLFGRSISSIGDAQKRLREAGAIVTSRGRYAATHPVIPRSVTKTYNHITWLIEAVNTQDGPVNLPGGRGDCQSTGGAGGLTVDGNQSHGGAGGLSIVNQPVSPPSINRSPPPLLLKDNSKKETTLEREREGQRLTKAIAIGIAAAASALPAAAAPIEPPAIIRPANAEISYDELKAKLMEAGGEAIGISAGLEVLAVPRRWLNAGCDLTEDILPAIRARAAKMPPRSVNSWNYFEQAVADARATRVKPMPEGRVCAVQLSTAKYDKFYDGVL